VSRAVFSGLNIAALVSRTSAARAHATIFKMADQSRHKSLDVLRGYVRDAEAFEDHAGAGLLQPTSRTAT
jgi:hypothetical protein